jgi:hypothetical protein
LILEGVLPFDFKLLEPERYLVQYDVDAFNAFPDYFELIQRSIPPSVKLSNTGDLIDDLTALERTYLDDARYISLEHDIVALWGDTRFREELVNVCERARLPVEVVIAIVPTCGAAHLSGNRHIRVGG